VFVYNNLRNFFIVPAGRHETNDVTRLLWALRLSKKFNTDCWIIGNLVVVLMIQAVIILEHDCERFSGLRIVAARAVKS